MSHELYSRCKPKINDELLPPNPKLLVITVRKAVSGCVSAITDLWNAGSTFFKLQVPGRNDSVKASHEIAASKFAVMRNRGHQLRAKRRRIAHNYYDL